MDGREALEDALRRRGRTWGEHNDDAIAQMHTERALLHRRPKLGATIMSKFFGGKAIIAYGDGCYLSCRVTSNARGARGN